MRIVTTGIRACPFVNQPMPLQVHVVDGNGAVQKISGQLQIEVLYDNEQMTRIANQDAVLGVSVNGKECPLQAIPLTEGFAQINVIFRQLTYKHSNVNFRLRVTMQGAESFVSRAMTVVALHLVIRERLEPVFFKDEGGRSNAIPIHIALVDHAGRVVPRDIPLKLTLCYAGSNRRVASQKILQIMSGPPRTGPTGETTLRVRILEVSKNHRKQAFCIMLSPDSSVDPRNFEVSSTVSTGVHVRSKRNKKRQSQQAAAPKEEEAPVRHNVPITARALNTRTQEQPMVTAEYPPLPLPPPQEHAGELARLRYQVDVLRRFAAYVAAGLGECQWHLAGFETSLEDGQPNTSRPLYRCPSCWTYKDAVHNANHSAKCFIYQALHAYESRVASVCDETAVPAGSANANANSASSGAALPLSSVSPTTTARGGALDTLSLGSAGSGMLPMQRLPSIPLQRLPSISLPMQRMQSAGLMSGLAPLQNQRWDSVGQLLNDQQQNGALADLGLNLNSDLGTTQSSQEERAEFALLEQGSIRLLDRQRVPVGRYHVPNTGDLWPDLQFKAETGTSPVPPSNAAGEVARNGRSLQNFRDECLLLSLSRAPESTAVDPHAQAQVA